MSIAFSPLAYGQLHRSNPTAASYVTGMAGSLYPGAGTTPGPGTSAAAAAALHRHHQGGDHGGSWHAQGFPTVPPSSVPSSATPSASGPQSELDKKLKELLDASAPVPFEASDLAAAEASQAQQLAAGVNAKPLGTPSAPESALCAETMLANFAEAPASRDLLLQTLPGKQREQLKELQRNWKATAMRGGRTSHAVLFLCLQPGGDPPDHPRISPRAKLEGWIDPTEEHTKLVRGSEAVLDALESQYRSIHRDMTFKRCLECHVEEARHALQQMRKKATESGRLLVHYNGHGMPPATAAGEVWFYDKERSHFVPLHICDIVASADSPSIYVFDCNSAASVLSFWRAHPTRGFNKDVFLCACSEEQRLPTNPVLPADFFTACLTTPLRAALVWYANYSDRQPLLPSLDTNLLDQVPGDEANKKTPRGELAFILSAVADTVAWCTVEPLHFHTLFRQDVMLKGLLRNFLLADRLMRETGCVPRSHPALPYHAHLHPAWQAWDVALEGVLSQIPSLLKSPNAKYCPSPFWKDQLSSFEVGLAVVGSAYETQSVPEQLPCVVLALGQSAYRYRALVLLSRYFEQGARAVHHGFACGVIGYVVRLLSNNDLIFLLLSLWLHMLRANHEVACAELVRAQAEVQLVNVLLMEHGSIEIKEVRNTLEELPGPEPYPLNSTHAALSGGAGFPTAVDGAGMSIGDGGATAAHVASPTARQPSQMAQQRTMAQSVSPGLTHQGAGPGSSAGGMGSPQGSVAFDASAAAASTASNAGSPTRPKYVAAAGMTLSRAKRIAAFILCAMISAGTERTAIACWNNKVLNAAIAMTEQSDDPECVSWGCLLLSRLCEFLPAAREKLVLEMALRHGLFLPLLQAKHPGVRASCVALLAKLLGCKIETFSGEDRDRALHVIRMILTTLLPELSGVSTEVRIEVTIAAFEFVHLHANELTERSAIQTGEFVDREYTAIGGHTRAVVRSRLVAVPGVDPGTQAGGLDAVPIDGRVRMVCEPLTYVRPTSSDAKSNAPPPEPLTSGLKGALNELVHDACLMCHAAITSPDIRITAAATAAYGFLCDGQRPVSARIAREGHRLALQLDRETQHAVSDQERTSERRNEDLMRQSLLRGDDTAALLLKTGKYEPSASNGAAVPTASVNTGGSSSALTMQSEPSLSTSSPTTRGGGAIPSPRPGQGAPGAPSIAVPKLMPFTLPVLSSMHPEGRVVAIALRQLEPHILSVDSKRNAVLTNYEALRAPTVKGRFTLPESIGNVEQIHVINDLASSPLSLAVGSTGIVIAHRGFLTGGAIQDAMTFNAAGGEDALPLGACITSSYRCRDGTFFFGGVPNEIRCISLLQEVIEQTLVVPGEGMVTSLLATANELLVGKDDGTVKIFDTRQDSRYLSMASAIGDSMPRTSKVHPRVIHACKSEAAPNEIFIAQKTGIKVYDVRKRTQPKRVVDLAGANPSAGSFIANFGASSQLPLMTAVAYDGTVFFLTTKCTEACEEAVRVPPLTPLVSGSTFSAPVSSANLSRGGVVDALSSPAPTSVVAQHAFAVHPLRPMTAIGKDLLVLTTDEARLATSLAI